MKNKKCNFCDETIPRDSIECPICYESIVQIKKLSLAWCIFSNLISLIFYLFILDAFSGSFEKIVICLIFIVFVTVQQGFYYLGRANLEYFIGIKELLLNAKDTEINTAEYDSFLGLKENSKASKKVFTINITFLVIKYVVAILVILYNL